MTWTPRIPRTQQQQQQQASEKVKEVNKRIERAREDVEELPGISETQEERTTRLNAFKKEEKNAISIQISAYILIVIVTATHRTTIGQLPPCCILH